jgi:serine/threonine-protein kinase
MPQTVVLRAKGDVVLRWGGLFAALRAAGITAIDIAHLLGFGSYLAPELRAGNGEGVRSDVFSLGATLYEALTGRPPFGGRTTSTVMAAVLADDGQPREQTGPGQLRSAILRAIERDPDDRWPDAARFREALEPVAAPALVAPTKRRGCLGGAAVAVIALVLWGVLR